MDTLTLGRLALPLVPGEGGPVLAGTPPAPTALGAVVNAHVTGAALPDLDEVLRTGRRASTSPALTVARPYPEDDLEALRADWEALTGLPAGDDVYVLKASWDKRRFLVPRRELLSLIEQLREIRKGGAAPARTAPPIDLEMLEAKAAEADRKQEGQGGLVQAVLALLAGHGLFDVDRLEENRRMVEGYPTLEGYLDAARELVAYYRSPERADYIQPLDDPPIVGGPVSIDWFRKRVPAPEGSPPLSWLAFCEWLLRTANITPDRGNELYSRIQGETYYLRFRREDGLHPALTWAEAIRRAR